MLKAPGWGPAATFWVFALLCAPALYITIKLIPETKGKSLEEIELYWKTHSKQMPYVVESAIIGKPT